MRKTVIETFDAIRGLDSAIAEKVCRIIWDAAEREMELRDALLDAVQDLNRWDMEQVRMYSDRDQVHVLGQDDQQWQEDVPW